MTNSRIKESKKANKSERGKNGWQAEKSAKTRQVILEAAIQCIVDFGYARTTTSLIAEIASVSRGAMMHHFPSRQAVIDATIRYLHKKQLKEYKKLMEAIGIPLEVMDNEKIEQSVDEAWKYVNLPSSVAYQEILMASRTDQELKQILEPLEPEFEKSFSEAVTGLFPPWGGHDELLQVHDFAMFTLTGMMLSHMKSNKRQRTKRVLDIVTSSVEHLYEQVRAQEKRDKQAAKKSA